MSNSLVKKILCGDDFKHETFGHRIPPKNFINLSLLLSYVSICMAKKITLLTKYNFETSNNAGKDHRQVKCMFIKSRGSNKKIDDNNTMGE